MTPKQIAESLTEAQREAILNARDLRSDHGGYPFFEVDFVPVWPAGIAEFLTLKADRLTPLGLAVRAVLAKARGE